MKEFNYGDRVIAIFNHKKFKGIIDYDHSDYDPMAVSSGNGYFVKPIDGTTFDHARYDNFGNCWINDNDIKPDMPILDESLFTL